MSEMLEKARKYEDEQGKQIKAEDRPAFHVSPYIGWMNDPNGFSYYQGEYHLFYQYYPYDTHWNSMHWGHVVSKDLLHWEYLPAALAPDEDYDKIGCFSGSAIELEDGRYCGRSGKNGRWNCKGYSDTGSGCWRWKRL